MTARATYTQADLARAIRAAEATGKVAVLTPAGIAFVDPGAITPHVQHQKPPEISGLDAVSMRR
jgi:hypothetical protein